MVENSTRTEPQMPVVWTAFGLYLLALLARAPEVVTARRFWAEDGHVFFEYAWNHGVLTALFNTDIGYLMLLSNLSSAVAVQFPLEWAPLVMIAGALLVQVLPAIVVALSGIPALTRGWRLPLALDLILFIPISEECYLNTANNQFYLMICGGLILASRGGRPGVERFKLAVLLLGGLTGVATILLTPLFWLRAVVAHRTKSADLHWRAVRAGILTLALIVQALAVSAAISEGDRAVSGVLGSLLTYLGVSQFALPLIGETRSTEVARTSARSLANGRFPILVSAMTLALGAALCALAWRARVPAVGWLFAAGIFTSVGSYLGAQAEKLDLIAPYFAHRYAFGSTALLAVGFFAAAGTEGRLGRLSRSIAVLISVWVLVLGANQFFEVRSYARSGPDWEGEVKVWRTDPTRSLMIWPRGWMMNLAPREVD